MSESLKEYCIRFGRKELLAQWHPEKNGSLSPDAVSCGSEKKIWWRCNQGHEWTSPPYERAKRGTGCPYCAGKHILPGMDLAALYPHLADQWHPEKMLICCRKMYRPEVNAPLGGSAGTGIFGER